MSTLHIHNLTEAEVLEIAPPVTLTELRNSADRGLLGSECVVRNGVRRYSFAAALTIQSIAALASGGATLPAGMILGAVVCNRAEEREVKSILGTGKDFWLLAYRMTAEKGAKRASQVRLERGNYEFFRANGFAALVRNPAWQSVQFSVYPIDSRIEVAFEKMNQLLASRGTRSL